MPLTGLHHLHLGSDDIENLLRFLSDFGLVEQEVHEGMHYLRTTSSASYQVIVEPASRSSLIALALEADQLTDLDRYALRAGSEVVPIQSPGGGAMVELIDPDGKSIRIVHGIAKRVADTPREAMVVNYASDRPRIGKQQLFAEIGPAQLLRLGHVGLFAQNMAACHEWYCDVLGLIPSDLMYAGPKENVVAGFYRIDRGNEWVDHHTLALFGFGKSELHHVSFEVADSESQFMAHRWLTRQQHEPIWGVGRHPRGSHVFDVWRAPGRFRFETFTDTDLMQSSHKADYLAIENMEMDLWVDRGHESYFA